MGKIDEIEYMKNIGEKWREDAFNKPFSEDLCGRYLIDLGSIMNLLAPPPGKLLDLGAGTGWTSVLFAQRGYDVVAQDIAKDMIEFGEKNKIRYNLTNLNFIACDYENLPFIQEFDYAIFYDCLHHCDDVYAALSTVHRALKPGGICITLEPGIGHAKAPGSIKAMEMWGVTERDMPPSLIIRAGKKAGFMKSKVYLRQHDAPFEILSYLSLDGLWKACKTFLRFLPGIGVYKSNITVLIK